MKTGRMILGIFLGLIIVVGIVVSIIYKDVLFRNEIHIDYPDGCQEIYINAELSTQECIEGRKMIEKQDLNDIVVSFNFT